MPEPILISIAAALAAKAATGLYDVVRDKFARNKEAMAELEAAIEKPDDPQLIEALAQRLDESEIGDAEFKEKLRGEWGKVDVAQHVDRGSIATNISGDVGKFVQARDVHGDINL